MAESTGDQPGAAKPAGPAGGERERVAPRNEQRKAGPAAGDPGSKLAPSEAAVAGSPPLARAETAEPAAAQSRGVPAPGGAPVLRASDTTSDSEGKEMATRNELPSKADFIKGDWAAEFAALRADMAKMMEQMSSRAGQAGGQISDAAHYARDRVAVAADQAYQTGKDMVGVAKTRVRSNVGELEQAIERNPLTSVLIAAGIGLIMGMLTRSR